MVEVLKRLLATAHGDTSTAFLIAAAALSTIAASVVPRLIDDIEGGGEVLTLEAS
jgi:hypothetical protein